jgi:hypothetical protein
MGGADEYFLVPTTSGVLTTSTGLVGLPEAGFSDDKFEKMTQIIMAANKTIALIVAICLAFLCFSWAALMRAFLD